MKTDYYVARFINRKEVPSSSVFTGQKDAAKACALRLNSHLDRPTNTRWRAVECK